MEILLLITLFKLFKWYKLYTYKQQIIIGSFCYETLPCQHDVYIGDKWEMLSAPDIINLFKEKNVELPETYKKHFKKYIN